MIRNTRRRLALAAVAVALAAPGAVAVTTTSASASTAAYCGIYWGSLAKSTSAGNLWSGNVTAPRTGRHTCYDRVVFDVARGSGKLGYNVRYVSTLTGPGSGLPIALAGGAKIAITINAPSRLGTSTTTFSGWQTFRQLKNIGSYEGYTDYGLGVRARLPMRVFVLDNTDGSKRLVVDVAHYW